MLKTSETALQLIRELSNWLTYITGAFKIIAIAENSIEMLNKRNGEECPSTAVCHMAPMIYL